MSLLGKGLESPRLPPDVGVFCGVVAGTPPPPAGVEEEGLRPPRTALASLPLGRTPPKSGALEVESGEPSNGGGMAGGVEPYEVPSWGDPGPRLLPAL